VRKKDKRFDGWRKYRYGTKFDTNWWEDWNDDNVAFSSFSLILEDVMDLVFISTNEFKQQYY
jgi:hypothetical protein